MGKAFCRQSSPLGLGGLDRGGTWKVLCSQPALLVTIAISYANVTESSLVVTAHPRAAPLVMTGDDCHAKAVKIYQRSALAWRPGMQFSSNCG